MTFDSFVAYDYEAVLSDFDYDNIIIYGTFKVWLKIYQICMYVALEDIENDKIEMPHSLWIITLQKIHAQCLKRVKWLIHTKYESYYKWAILQFTHKNIYDYFNKIYNTIISKKSIKYLKEEWAFAKPPAQN